MLRQHPLGGLVSLVYKPLDLAVYLLRGLLAVRLGERHLAAAGGIIIRDVADLLAHTEVGHHCVCLAGELLQIVEGAGGDFSVYQLLCHAAADSGRHLVHNLLAGGELTLLRQIPGCAQRLSARDYGDFEQRIRVRQNPADSGVARLVMRDGALLICRNYLALALQTAHNAVDCIQKVLFFHHLLVVAGGYQGRLVAHVGNVGAGESGSLLCQEVHIKAGGQLDFAQMHLEYGQALLELGQIHVNLAVKAAGTHQGAVQHVGTVGCGQHYHAGVGAEAVHLGEQLVEGVLPLVVGREADILAAGASHGVDFVYEHYAGGLLLGLAEQVAHAGGAHAHEHLHEVRAGNGEERHICLARNGLGQQGLAGAGRAHQKGSLWYLAAQGGVFLGVLEEVHNLHNLHLGLLQARHILECNFVLLLVAVKYLGLRLADIEYAAGTAAAPHSAHRHCEHHHKEDYHQGYPYPVGEVGPAVAVLLDHNIETVQLRQLLQHGVELGFGVESLGHQKVEIRAVLGLHPLLEIVLVAVCRAALDVDLAALQIAHVHDFLHAAGGQNLVADLKPLFFDRLGAAAADPHIHKPAEEQEIDEGYSPPHRTGSAPGAVAAGGFAVLIRHRRCMWFFPRRTRGPPDGRIRDILS